MNRTRNRNEDGTLKQLACGTDALSGAMGCGKETAIKIATAAGARIQIGRRVLWNISKVQKYLDEISE